MLAGLLGLRERDRERRIARALDVRDAAALRGDLGDQAVDLFGALLAATGDASVMLERLAGLPLGPRASDERADLETVAAGVRAEAPDIGQTPAFDTL